MTTIAVINACTVLPDAKIAPMVAAIQKQVVQELAPPPNQGWGVSATLVFIPKGQQPPADAWWCVVLDNSDQAGVLGYHDVTSSGKPMAKVFAGSDLAYGTSVSVTISHEIIEMLVDPWCNRYVLKGTRLWCVEPGDAVEADRYGHLIDGVLVSNFTLPAYFGNSVGSKYDFGAKLQQAISSTAPMLPGGYMSYYDLLTRQWNQVTARLVDPETLEQQVRRRFRERPHDGSRRRKRQIVAAGEDLLLSTAH